MSGTGFGRAGSAEVGAFCPPLRLLVLDNLIGINARGRRCRSENPQRNANYANLCTTRLPRAWLTCGFARSVLEMENFHEVWR